MSEVCRAFGISRKTGYKIFSRYKDRGLDALAGRSLRPVRYANQLPDRMERLIVDLKRNKRRPAMCPIGPSDAGRFARHLRTARLAFASAGVFARGVQRCGFAAARTRRCATSAPASAVHPV
jgi:hypothetical protein